MRIFHAVFDCTLVQSGKRAPLELCVMVIVALLFGPSMTGYTAGADHFNYDHRQWIADGYVDGGGVCQPSSIRQIVPW